MTILAFTVLGSPVGQGSKRHVGNGVMIENAKLKPWRQAVACEAHNAAVKAGWSIETHGARAIKLRIDVECVRPRTHFRKSGPLKPGAPKWPSSRKGHDLDKIARGIGDALAGTLYGNDRQIVSLSVSATYGSVERAWLEVSDFE